jgi:hypothetical protein
MKIYYSTNQRKEMKAEIEQLCWEIRKLIDSKALLHATDWNFNSWMNRIFLVLQKVMQIQALLRIEEPDPTIKESLQVHDKIITEFNESCNKK